MSTLSLSTALLVAAAGVYAGAQNAIAGGGSFITFPALLLAGLNPLAANMTSTIALFPSQITTSVAGRKLAGGVDAGAHHLSLKQLIVISLIGGVLGALLLLATPPSFFAKLVPYLVLFATSVFAWGSFRRKPLHAASGLSSTTLATIQFAIAIYGGYFGGGIGFLMLAALTVAGQQVRMAAATKNVLAMTMNASAVAVFAFSPQVNWAAVLALGIGGIAGGFAGAWLLHRLPEKVLRGFVVVVGVVLTVWLFVRA
ncbi:TSUP family transporter [Ralstonia insidiosa]|uniref:Probable membrane transporter protein n=2 Tax=Pseudomonadota TaxID=1224 RepID=A0A191ZZ58_9RALS|nr:TSUP family transporter [Ralstonia insidiosa]ANJ73409.1 transporter [Ralstonia insidiosa]KAB0473782.1 sulfite exporter TauE/SafE family protein [Ralstonia insidiosa]MBY4911115.1 TSUP family transporter [Ralstonia insidiosa]